MADPADDLLPLLGIHLYQGRQRESDESSSDEDADESFSSG